MRFDKETVDNVLTDFAKQTEVLSLDKASGKVTIDYNRIVDGLLFYVNASLEAGEFGETPEEMGEGISERKAYENATHFLEEIAFFFLMKRLHELYGEEDE